MVNGRENPDLGGPALSITVTHALGLTSLPLPQTALSLAPERRAEVRTEA